MNDQFEKGQHVRVVGYPGRPWLGNTGAITRTPDEEANPGAGPSGSYAMTFDGRGDQQFAPFQAHELEAA